MQVPPVSPKGARTLTDLQLDGQERVVIGCAKCDRQGSYSLARLIAAHGQSKGLPDLLADISHDCPRRTAHGLDRCGAVYLPG